MQIPLLSPRVHRFGGADKRIDNFSVDGSFDAQRKSLGRSVQYVKALLLAVVVHSERLPTRGIAASNDGKLKGPSGIGGSVGEATERGQFFCVLCVIHKEKYSRRGRGDSRILEHVDGRLFLRLDRGRGKRIVDSSQG